MSSVFSMPSCTSISCHGAWSMNEYDFTARTNSEMRSVPDSNDAHKRRRHPSAR